jgi:hypothetical protein
VYSTTSRTRPIGAVTKPAELALILGAGLLLGFAGALFLLTVSVKRLLGKHR